MSVSSGIANFAADRAGIEHLNHINPLPAMLMHSAPTTM